MSNALGSGWQWAAVAAGAAAGAVMRWQAGVWFNTPGATVPLGTLLVNCAGGFLIGVALVAFGRVPHEALRLLLVTGFLGGLTTFSTFSGESLAMIERGAWAGALAHTLAHVVGALGCAAAGAALTRACWPAAA